MLFSLIARAGAVALVFGAGLFLTWARVAAWGRAATTIIKDNGKAKLRRIIRISWKN
jgi:hypothetical protein